MTENQPKKETPNFLEINWEKHPDKSVLLGMGRSLTYDQLRNRARLLAKSLYGLGVRAGDQIAIMSYNAPEVLELGHALTYLEVGLVMVGYRMKAPEIEFIVDNSDSKILFFYHEFADHILPHKEKYTKILPGGFISFGESAVEGTSQYESLFTDVSDIDLDTFEPAEEVGSSMIYTSGTTGMPKGAARSTDFVTKDGVMDYLFSTISFFKMEPDEIHLVCCPMYHSAPSYFHTITFLLGGTMLYQPRFDPQEFLELVDKYKVTSTHLVPTMVTQLLEVPKEVTDKLDLSSLRTVICGAAPLFPEYKLAFLDRFGPCLYEYYGATETGLNTAITPEEMRERPGSVGKSFANNELIIYDENGKEVQNGERGIFYMYNSIMMDGYYKNQNATSDAYQGKYMTAGDVAIRDEEGYYFIVDRIKDMIIRGGVNIYPVEIEGVMSTMPAIKDVAVVGKSDKKLGETVTAFVVLNTANEASAEEIQTFCGKQLANYKIPSDIIFLDEIPRTPTGKILKRELRERL
ncbi:MAG: AMP-binding protein [Deltaproteobacteria bacterium]|nr:AMP-binding protein [Deltaproteobacteria bacterium]